MKMKTQTTIVLAVVTACLVPAAGATDMAFSPPEPDPGDSVAFKYDKYYDGPLLSPELPPPTEMETISLDPIGDYGESCGRRPAGGSWKLPQPCVTRALGIDIGGWVQQGVTFNGSHPVDGLNGAVNRNHHDTDHMLNQAWLYAARPVDAGGCGWDIGGRIDVYYGTDWAYDQSQGLEDRVNAVDVRNGFSLPQAYLEVGGNGLSVKMGHFAGLLGYEAIPAPANFFYSHSHSFAAEPLLLTGLQADYQLSSQWTVSAGFNRGWNKWEDNNDQFDFLGGIQWNSCDQQTSLSFMLQTGPWDNAGDDNQCTYVLVAEQKMTDRLTYVLQHNLGYADDFDAGADAQWYSLAQYFFYELDPCWSFGARFEIFWDDDGTRVVSWNRGTGFTGEFSELTLGLNWKPHPNVVFRPEARWDWFDGAGLPFVDGTESNQFTTGLDLVVTF